MPRGFAPPNAPQVGCTRLAVVRLITKCADMFTPHLLSPRPPAAADVEAAAAVAECTQQRRET